MDVMEKKEFEGSHIVGASISRYGQPRRRVTHNPPDDHQ
jgi:hypothetical protein